MLEFQELGSRTPNSDFALKVWAKQIKRRICLPFKYFKYLTLIYYRARNTLHISAIMDVELPLVIVLLCHCLGF